MNKYRQDLLDLFEEEAENVKYNNEDVVELTNDALLESHYNYALIGDIILALPKPEYILAVLSCAALPNSLIIYLETVLVCHYVDTRG